jgi:hypothetical protein
MRLQQDAAIVVDEVPQRRSEILPGAIDRLGAIVRTDLRHLFESLKYIQRTGTLDLEHRRRRAPGQEQDKRGELDDLSKSPAAYPTVRIDLLASSV